jgi:hypothetical protein
MIPNRDAMMIMRAGKNLNAWTLYDKLQERQLI